MNQRPRTITEHSARSLVTSTAPYLSCEQCFDLMDQYVDALVVEGPGQPEWAAFEVHLRGCGACDEEVATLLELATTHPGTPDEGATR